MLALGSACYMVALALAQAVIALKGHALVALGWIIGVVAFLLGHVAVQRRPVPPRRDRPRRVVGRGDGRRSPSCLRYKLASGAVPDDGSVLEAITDMPLESLTAPPSGSALASDPTDDASREGDAGLVGFGARGRGRPSS